MLRNKRHLLGALTILALVGTTRPAMAQEANNEVAKAHYEKGVTHYNLGRFKPAIGEFEQAYELTHAPILLFNIAQAYRQESNTERALFFYRRYLSLDPKAKNRAEVQKRIRDLEELQDKQTEVKKKPPTEVEQTGASSSGTGTVASEGSSTPAGGTAGKTTEQPTGGEGGARQTEPGQGGETTGRSGGEVVQPVEAPRRSGFSFAAGGGISVPVFSGADLNSPLDFAAQLQVSYALPVGRSSFIDAGVRATFSPLSYNLVTSGEEKTAKFIGLFAAATFRHPLSDHLSILGELGAGVVAWSGLDEGNPFTKENASASGALAMPSLRVGAGVRYQTNNGLFGAIMPAYGYSIAASGLRASSVQIIEGFLLVGYAL